MNSACGRLGPDEDVSTSIRLLAIMENISLVRPNDEIHRVNLIIRVCDLCIFSGTFFGKVFLVYKDEQR